MEIAAILILGLAIGGVLGWFLRSASTAAQLALARQRAEQAERQLGEVREQASVMTRQRDAALEQLRDESTKRASFEAVAAAIPELQREVEARSMTLAQQTRTILEITRDKEALAATIEAERKGFDEKLKLLEDAKKALADAFNALSSNALRSNSEEFLKLAQASVAPIKEALGKFDLKIQSLEVAREGAYQGLVQQVSQLLDTGRQLRSETSNLVQALRSPVVRGQWGEIQLRRVVEMAGMQNYCDFIEQETLRTESGVLRPDLVVKLPAGKTIVVDAKAPVSSYLDAMAATDEGERKLKLQAFAKLVRERITELMHLAPISARKGRRPWADEEVFKGLVLAVLTNSIGFAKIERLTKIPEFEEQFNEFSIQDYAASTPGDIEKIVAWFTERKAGATTRRQGLKDLVRAANKLLEHREHHGSLEAYFTDLMQQKNGDAIALTAEIATAPTNLRCVDGRQRSCDSATRSH